MTQLREYRRLSGVPARLRGRLVDLSLLAIVATLPILPAGCDAGVPVPPGMLPFNFGVVAEGQVYRAAQPTPEGLEAAICQLGLKTVVNLRGENPGKDWWDHERDVCQSQGVAMVNIRMSARALPSRETLLLLYDTFQAAEYPILIHCEGGADRTGAAAAIWRMMQGESREAAARELSPAHFHFVPFAPEMDLLVSIFDPDRDWILNEYDAGARPSNDD